jgi:hypothetical protein
MTEVAESGHHDLCFLSEPCSKDVPEHGFCSRQSTFCIHCERECICERLKQAENYARIAVMHTVDVDSYEQGQRDALAQAVQRVEAVICTDCLEHLTLGDVWATCLSCDGAWEALEAIKGDQP